MKKIFYNKRIKKYIGMVVNPKIKGFGSHKIKKVGSKAQIMKWKRG